MPKKCFYALIWACFGMFRDKKICPYNGIKAVLYGKKMKKAKKCFYAFLVVFNGGYLKKNAFLNIFRKIKKCSHFKTFHIKTKNKTENWFCLGPNITNDARND